MSGVHYSACMLFGCDPQFKLKMLAWVAVYALLVLGSVAVLHFTSVPGVTLRVLIALLPVIPLFALLSLGMQSYRKRDELQKKIISEGIMFGFGAAAIVTLSYGFLQMNDLAPDVQFVWVWPILGSGWIGGLILARQRYS
jgi:hypothetical protein